MATKKTNRSASAKAGWRTRWKAGKHVGAKGAKYLKGVEKRKRRQGPGGGPIKPPPVKPKKWTVEDPVRRTGKKKK